VRGVMGWTLEVATRIQNLGGRGGGRGASSGVGSGVERVVVCCELGVPTASSFG
jgi:hypothetical protein